MVLRASSYSVDFYLEYVLWARGSLNNAKFVSKAIDA